MDGDVDDLVALLEEMAAAGETLTPDMLNYADASGRVRRKKRIRCTILGQGFLESCGAGWKGDPSLLHIPPCFDLLSCLHNIFSSLVFLEKVSPFSRPFLSFWRPHLLFPEEKQSTEYYMCMWQLSVCDEILYIPQPFFERMKGFLNN